MWWKTLFLFFVGSSSSFVLSTENGQRPILASLNWSLENGYQMVPGKLVQGPETVAWANFTNAINQTGWSYLEVTTNAKFPDKIQVCTYAREEEVSFLCKVLWRWRGINSDFSDRKNKSIDWVSILLSLDLVFRRRLLQLVVCMHLGAVMISCWWSCDWGYHFVRVMGENHPTFYAIEEGEEKFRKQKAI